MSLASGPIEGTQDEPKLDGRYWATYGLIVAQLLGEIFDFVIVGFLVTALGPRWHMTYGQGAIIFFAAGIGALVGALVLGSVADRYGRKVAIVGGGLLYSAAAGAVAFIPEGSWLLLALLRFLVGVGYGGAGSSQFALVVEATPLRVRTALTSALAAPAAIGIPLASATVALFYPALGWRGIAALGFVPIIFAVGIAIVARESASWRSRVAGGATRGALRQVLADRRRSTLIILTQLCFGAALTGVLLWGPLITAQVLGLPLAKAAKAFFWVTVAGIIGRLMFIWLAVRLGRRIAGVIMGFGGGLFLILAAVTNGLTLGAIPCLLLFLALGQLFYDGGFANLNPYAAELYPADVAATAVGVGSAAGGIGKIIGPLSLGLIAGGNEVISPKATAGAILPGFLFLGVCCLVGGLCFLFLGIETHRRAQGAGASTSKDATLPTESSL